MSFRSGMTAVTIALWVIVGVLGWLAANVHSQAINGALGVGFWAIITTALTIAAWLERR